MIEEKEEISVLEPFLVLLNKHFDAHLGGKFAESKNFPNTVIKTGIADGKSDGITASISG